MSSLDRWHVTLMGLFDRLAPPTGDHFYFVAPYKKQSSELLLNAVCGTDDYVKRNGNVTFGVIGVTNLSYCSLPYTRINRNYVASSHLLLTASIVRWKLMQLPYLYCSTQLSSRSINVMLPTACACQKLRRPRTNTTKYRPTAILAFL